jgi:hypothetical protein
VADLVFDLETGDPVDLDTLASGDIQTTGQIDILLVVVGADRGLHRLEVGEAGHLDEPACQYVFVAAFVKVGFEFELGLKVEAGVTLGNPAEIIGSREVEIEGQGQGTRVGSGWVLGGDMPHRESHKECRRQCEEQIERASR